MRKRSTVERAFEAYCQMMPQERAEFSKLCQGYDRGVNGPAKPKAIRKPKVEPPAAVA